jgi:pyruvate formate lyase activating enzyme
MARCIHCQKESALISSPLELCADCIRNHFEAVRPHIQNVHARVRERFGLPRHPPREEDGLECPLCMNQCRIPDGERGYCGVRLNREGQFAGGTEKAGNFSRYHDPLPTNCVANWICPGGTGCGYPRFSHAESAEHGYTNLAVFFRACTFNCLFCQNWFYREYSLLPGRLGPEAIAMDADENTSCICYFGGDPTPQILYALKASQIAWENRKGDILRICWETNGSMNERFLDRAVELSLQSGGCIKFDLKAWSEELHLALCGVSNSQTLSNFARVAGRAAERPEPPLLAASTLLIPGYVDEEEISRIATFIASLDPLIPYSLLAFYPHFCMQDLPTTSRKHAERCRKAACAAGLERVKVGNIHLLRNAY